MKKHRGSVYSVYLVRLINYREPLFARARDPDVDLDQSERDLLVDMLENRVKLPRGGAKSAARWRERLKLAAYYLQYAAGEPPEGQDVEALRFAVKECKRVGIDVLRQARRDIKNVRALTDGRWRWWDIASRMARKRKFEQLHRTY